MRKLITLPALIFICLVTLGSSSVLEKGVHFIERGFHVFEDEVHKIFAGVKEKVEHVPLFTSFVKFVHEFTKINSEINHVRQIITNSSREIIEVFDHLSLINTSLICGACQNFVTRVRTYEESQKVLNAAEKAVEFMCSLKANKTFCAGIVTTFGQIWYDSIIDKTMNSAKVCQNVRACPRTIHPESIKKYAQDVLKDKPATNIPTPNGKSTYKVLHMTDPHIDLDYAVGSNAYCDDPFCCHADDGLPSDPTKGAQYWGTPSACDIPMRTFDQFLKFASSNFEVDFIMWTGDNINHDIWHQHQATQTDITKNATQLIKQYFPNTTIYPMFGNHEAYPADQFDVIGNNSQWLISQLSDMWTSMLDADALATFKNRSFYSTFNQKLNVKIIALDTQVCDSMNFYLMRDPTDPLHQLDWLRSELYDAESNNISVLIMGHIPPGDFTCDSQWAARYRALVDRFTNIIRGQFFGHTHNDQFEVVRSYADNSPVGTIFITPSLTTFSTLYPSFRIFEMDSETHQPVNFYQYRLDLDKWNQNTTGPIEFDLAYNMKDEYNMTDLSFASFDKLAERFNNESIAIDTYVFNFESGAVPQAIGKPSEGIVDNYYCLAKHSVSSDVLSCLGYHVSLNDILMIASQLLPGGWYFDKC